MPSVIGRTAGVDVRVSAMRKSPQAPRNVNSAAVTIAFRLIGTTIDTKARKSLAPSTSAASTRLGGIDSMNARMSRIAKGTWTALSARISPT